MRDVESFTEIHYAELLRTPTGKDPVIRRFMDRWTHQRFAARHDLPMPLLTDENRRLTKQYAAHWLFAVWKTRGLVVIDAQGIVRTQHVMLRAFRPSDKRILAAIHLAQYDQLITRPF